jgi:hypothetical protein
MIRMRSVRRFGSLVVAVALAARVEAQPAPSFVFQNNFWVNLHQFLYSQSLINN